MLWPPIGRNVFVVVVILSLAGGCATDPMPLEVARIATPVDLSGHWEIDYARSENLNDRLNSVARKIQREAARREQLSQDGRGYAGGPLPGRRQLITLARLAEIITEPTLLEVIQGEGRARIKRENSFALVCETEGSEQAVTIDTLGVQRCGWDGSQLFFMLNLQDGLDVTHRLSRSREGDVLLLVTSVETADTSVPLVVSQYFNRFDPDALGYRCERSLTRGKVCTTR